MVWPSTMNPVSCITRTQIVATSVFSTHLDHITRLLPRTVLTIPEPLFWIRRWGQYMELFTLDMFVLFCLSLYPFSVSPSLPFSCFVCVCVCVCVCVSLYDFLCFCLLLYCSSCFPATCITQYVKLLMGA